MFIKSQKQCDGLYNLFGDGFFDSHWCDLENSRYEFFVIACTGYSADHLDDNLMNPFLMDDFSDGRKWSDFKALLKEIDGDINETTND